ncbi:methionine biosynthesis protein MetW [Thermoflavifilum thermophilum]|uniref:Methionine biosynthesis protein MetW n=1 Tax=Thermoflavifilum thermophilum TaxID=1393122 RepID=A0A1I7MYI6_9BACT|nr:methionine biosynthesis protein MetW [Thermoflavifilum thermophilum]SFV27483.1 methionine biosynthesis protein MetW [Thermoflavifilum thermophilum]
MVNVNKNITHTVAIDHPEINDNRNYNYLAFPVEERPEYSRIVSMIQAKSRVIDLGCGNGSLLQRLIKEKEVKAYGIELSESGVTICKEKGLQVEQGYIDERLPFQENAFDYAICNVTIQMVRYPEVLLTEMKRIAKYQIISFPNFAFYKNRIEMIIKGRMPKKMLFGYSWYNTGHIHQLSIKDMIELIQTIGGLKIIKIDVDETGKKLKNKIIQLFPNLFCVVPIFFLEKIEK